MVSKEASHTDILRIPVASVEPALNQNLRAEWFQCLGRSMCCPFACVPEIVTVIVLDLSSRDVFSSSLFDTAPCTHVERRASTVVFIFRYSYIVQLARFPG